MSKQNMLVARAHRRSRQPDDCYTVNYILNTYNMITGN